MNEFNILIRNKIKKLQNINEENGINKEISEYMYLLNSNASDPSESISDPGESIPINKNSLYKYIKRKDHIYLKEDIEKYIEKELSQLVSEDVKHIALSQPAHIALSQPAHIALSQPAHINFYSEYLGKNSVLNVLYNFKNISGDFLTGIYIGNCYVKKDHNISFHFGYSEILHGINNYLGKKHSKLWDYYFADKECINSKKLLNGHCNSGDIENINIVLSIKNDLYKISEKISFYTCDIYPKNIKYLYNSLLFAFEAKNFSFIRINNSDEWDNLQFINFILFVMMMFKKVKIFKASWFDKPKYYLILSDLINSDQVNIIVMNYIKYLEHLTSYDKYENICYLFTKKFITKYIREYINICKLKNDIQVQKENKDILNKWISNFTK